MSKGSFCVRILGCDFELGPGAPEELRGKWGSFDLQDRQILYAAHLDGATCRETVFHELLHAADVSVSTASTQLTEEQVTSVAAVLFGILRDHKSLVEWLFGGRDE